MNEDWKDVINEVLNGNTSAYAKIITGHKASVATVCMNMLRDVNDAEEVGQKVFIKLYRSLEKFRHEANLSTYISRIAINECLNFLKKRQKERGRNVQFDDAPSSQLSTTTNLAFETRETLDKALKVLDPNARSVVVMRMIEGYSIKETAEVLSLTEGTVMSKLHRSLKKMKEALMNMGYEKF